MREKLETLTLIQLKELARGQGLKVSGMKKAEIIDRLVELADKKPENKPQELLSMAASNIVELKKSNEALHSQEETASGASEASEAGRVQEPAAQLTGGQAAGQASEAVRAQTSEREPEHSQENAQTQSAARPQTQARSQMQGRSEQSGYQTRSQGGERLNYQGRGQNGDRQVYQTRGQNGDRRSYQTRVQNGDRQNYQNRAQNTDQRGMQRNAAAGAAVTASQQPQSAQKSNEKSHINVQTSEASAMAEKLQNEAVKQYTDPAEAKDAAAQPNQTGASEERKPEAQAAAARTDAGQISPELNNLDSGLEANGILEVMSEGFGFIRCENYLPGENDVYVAPSQIRRFNLKTGDIIRGNRRVRSQTERFAALLYITSINGYPVIESERRPQFENLTPIFPNEKIVLAKDERAALPLRVMDLLSPIGKGQRGMIASQPKAGKTTILKQVAKSIIKDRDMHLIILLIDERPEEVTDIKEEVVGPNVEVIYSTFDELPERHKRVSEMVIERAKRLVEYGKDVTILLDSITRLARAYNLVVPPSGRTLSGGLDPAALHMPKRFFGAARNMREGGSLTILATALVDTGSRMDDVIYEEFKGTGNMEIVLDRKLSEKRIFPAIDLLKSSTRRDDLLLTQEEQDAVKTIRKAFSSVKSEDAVEKVLDLFTKTRNNQEFVQYVSKIKFF